MIAVTTSPLVSIGFAAAGSPLSAAPAATVPGAATDAAAPAVPVFVPGAAPVPGAPASSFDAMLAALVPQADGPPSVPAIAAPVASDGAAPSDDGDGETDTGDASDTPFLAALAGLGLIPVSPQSAASAPASAAPPSAGPRIAHGPTLAAAAAPASIDSSANPPAAAATAAPDGQAAASPVPATPPAAADIEALFPGLTQRLAGTPPRARAGRPLADAVAVAATPATSATGAVVPAAAAIMPAKSGEHELAATAPALDPIAAPAPAAPAPAHSADAAVTTAPAAAPDAVQQQLDVARDGAWLDRLARDIAGAADRDARLHFQLNPEHLGTLKVELANGADGTSVRLTADSEAARGLLADRSQRLFAEARAQGMRIADARIELAGPGGSPGGSSGFGAGQSFGQQAGQQQQGQRAAWQPLAASQANINHPIAEAVRGSGERYA